LGGEIKREGRDLEREMEIRKKQRKKMCEKGGGFVVLKQDAVTKYI